MGSCLSAVANFHSRDQNNDSGNNHMDDFFSNTASNGVTIIHRNGEDNGMPQITILRGDPSSIRSSETTEFPNMGFFSTVPTNIGNPDYTPVFRNFTHTTDPNERRPRSGFPGIGRFPRRHNRYSSVNHHNDNHNNRNNHNNHNIHNNHNNHNIHRTSNTGTTETEDNQPDDQIYEQLRIMEQIFSNFLRNPRQPHQDADTFMPGFFVQQQMMQQDEENRAPPPTSKKALRQIPTVLVSPDDLADESNRECCICLELNNLGEKVARLPCGHLFHRPCIHDWLTKHNTCPICRYELETDDPVFERGRKQRMSTRKQRYRPHELKRMTIRELKSLASQLGIAIGRAQNGIMDKKDFICMIMDSGKIDVVTSSMEPVEYKLSDLRRMGVGQLKKAMSDGGVFFDPVDVLEKEDMVQIFLNSGRLIVIPEVAVPDLEPQIKETNEMDYDNIHTDPMDTTPDVEMEEHSITTTSVHSSAQPPPIATTRNDVSSYPSSTSQTSFSSHSISQLKSFARELNIDIHDCVEKQDMIERIVNAVEGVSGSSRRQRRRL